VGNTTHLSTSAKARPLYASSSKAKSVRDPVENQTQVSGSRTERFRSSCIADGVIAFNYGEIGTRYERSDGGHVVSRGQTDPRGIPRSELHVPHWRSSERRIELRDGLSACGVDRLLQRTRFIVSRRWGQVPLWVMSHRIAYC
jgi:hypothetical protein